MAKLLKILWEYMDLTVLPFFETWSAHIFGGWQRVCWCTNEAFNRASPTKEFWENCPQKKVGHIYGKNEGWAYLRKLLYSEECSTEMKEHCFEFPGHECTTETSEQCKDVQRKVCHDQPTEQCSTEYSVNDFSKPIWIWFGICVLQNQFFSFQTKLELVWKIVRNFWV